MTCCSSEKPKDICGCTTGKECTCGPDCKCTSDKKSCCPVKCGCPKWLAILLLVAMGAAGQYVISNYVLGQSSTPVVSERTEDGTEVLLRVNGAPITQGMIDARRALINERAGAMFAQLPPEEQTRVLRENLIVETLVDQNMAGSGFEKKPEVQNQLRDAQAQVLRTAYLDQLADSAITDESLKSAYDTLVAQIPETPEIRARHILVESEATAKDVIARLGKGEPFEALAAELSKDVGNAKQGGDLGWFAKELMVPEFGTAAFAMKAGETSTAPVKSPFGWHVIRVEETRVRPKPSFEEMRPSLIAQKRQEVIQSLVAEWRAAAEIEGLEEVAPTPVPAPTPEAAPTDTQAEPAPESAAPAAAE